MLPSAISRLSQSPRRMARPGRGWLGLPLPLLIGAGLGALLALLAVAALLTMGVTPTVAPVVTELPQS
ncbi:MAG: hypothetical protein INF43_01140 [Alphaproteobacteria bacterium]|nr:hypothetical protein [Alphaproteobacteria bacterium]